MISRISRPIHAVLGMRRGEILTPDLCQICLQHGPGIVTVQGINGERFSAHRWPCADREGLPVVANEEGQ